MARRVLLRRILHEAIYLSMVVFLLGVLVLIASSWFDPSSLPGEVSREFGIIFCSLGLISILYELLIRRQLIEDYNGALRDIVDPDTRKLGITALFSDREDKTLRGRSIQELLRSARGETVAVGLGFYEFLPDQRQLLLDKLRAGCSFRFLIFNSLSGNAHVLDASLAYGDGSMVKRLEAQRAYFIAFQNELAEANIAADRFQIRTYDAIPTFGAIHIDPKGTDAKLVVEFYGYRVEGSICPGIELVQQSSRWYAFYDRQIEGLWKTALPLVPSPPAAPPSASTVP